MSKKIYPSDNPEFATGYGGSGIKSMKVTNNLKKTKTVCAKNFNLICDCGGKIIIDRIGWQNDYGEIENRLGHCPKCNQLYNIENVVRHPGSTIG